MTSLEKTIHSANKYKLPSTTANLSKGCIQRAMFNNDNKRIGHQVHFLKYNVAPIQFSRLLDILNLVLRHSILQH